MIKEIFEEIKKEARNGRLNLIEKVYEDDIIYPVYLQFNVVDNKELKEMSNLYINDYETFYDSLKKYVYLIKDIYNIELNRNNIKEIIVRLFSNLGKSDMNDLISFINKYIYFLTNSKLSDLEEIKFVNDEIGNISSKIELQSINQETPYCFKSKFVKDDKIYNLPRISFGIVNNVCYIYSVQNKDKNIVDDNNIDYVNLIRENVRTINSSIKKYRNVTPSFVISLTNFINYMNSNGISNFCVVPSLPLRISNREKTTKLKIEKQTKIQSLNENELNEFKEMVEKNKIRDNYQATEGFVNNFNRLKIHFYDCMNIIPNDIDDRIIFEIDSLITQTPFLNAIVKNNNVMIK